MIKFQISNPRIINVFNKDDNTVDDAMESIFPLDTEFAFLIWNHIYIPLNYKYDVSLMFDDLVRLLNFIYDKKSSSIEIHWASNSFSSIWSVDRVSDYIIIRSTWHYTLGSLKDLLNKKPEIKVAASDLANEIRVMISFINKCLKQTGYYLLAYQIDDILRNG